MPTAQQVRDTWWNGLTASQKRKNRHDIWMRRSGQWHGGKFGIDWRPVKLLGRGSYGICGLFRYVGNDANMPPNIVVKQANAANDEDLRIESDFLAAINNSTSAHIVRMYQSILTEHGTGTHPEFDPIPSDTPANRLMMMSDEHQLDGSLQQIWYNSWRPTAYPEVSRIYIEYCDLKNLEIFRLNQYGKRGATGPPNLIPPELVVWRLWESLAKALVVLECGESGTEHVTHWSPVIHFDIKGPNVFVKTNAGAASPEFKFADFGCAQYWPGEDLERTPGWIVNTTWRGTRGYKAPEVVRPTHPNRKLGLKADVWSVASSIYAFVTGIVSGLRDSPTLRMVDCGPTGRRVRGKFRRLLFRCLALDPDHRPGAKELLKEIRDVIRIATINANDPRLWTQFQVTAAAIDDYPVVNNQPHNGPAFRNPNDPQRQKRGQPQPPPPFLVEELDLDGAQEPNIMNNSVGGKPRLWVPLSNEFLDETIDQHQTMREIAQRELDEAAGIVPNDPFAGDPGWIKLAAQYAARHTRDM